MRRKFAILGLLAGALSACAQNVNTNVIYTPVTMTATAQTSSPLALGAGPQWRSWATGNITLVGTGLTTATFGVLGSADGGVTYYAVPLNALATPNTLASTATATANGMYQVNLAGLTHVEFVTSGTFTATSIALTLTVSPTGTLARTTGTGIYALLGSPNVYSGSGAANTSVALYNGTLFSGGTASNNYPHVFYNFGTTPTNFNTNGTVIGINCASTSPTAFQVWVNGGSNASLTCGGTFTMGTANVNTFTTQANCSSAASPAVCAGAASGSIAVPAAATTLTVNTTRVTAASQIQVTFDSSLGTRLSVTCNTTPIQPTVSTRTAGTSFVVTMASAPATNPACLSYTVIN